MKIGVETDWQRTGFPGPSWRWLGEGEFCLVEQVTIRRGVVRLAHPAVDPARQRNPKTKCHTGSFQTPLRSAPGGPERFQMLIAYK